jgi:tryptophan synthase alpha chain
MMSQTERTFDALRRNRRKALMPYLTMGYPELESALTLVPALAEAGADLIELGVPFSDPLADGATIQASSQQALDNGMTLSLCLQQAATLRAQGQTIPFILMGYYNPILQMGLVSFAQRAANAGIDGVIVPDLPPEEAADLHTQLDGHEIDLIFLLAPTSNQARVHNVVGRASGFLYLVSLTGVTGAREQLPPGLEAFVARVRSATELPLAVGFGIGTPDQAAQVARIADGVIVGSALIRAVGDAYALSEDPATAARTFVAALRSGIDSETPE